MLNDRAAAFSDPGLGGRSNGNYKDCDVCSTVDGAGIQIRTVKIVLRLMGEAL